MLQPNYFASAILNVHLTTFLGAAPAHNIRKHSRPLPQLRVRGHPHCRCWFARPSCGEAVSAEVLLEMGAQCGGVRCRD